MKTNNELIEEILELCWTASEDGIASLNRESLPKELLCFLPQPIEGISENTQETIDSMIEGALLAVEANNIRLTASGYIKAQEVVRRHRLAEVLLGNVLEVSDSAMESTACKVEHILNSEVTDAVCTFLGHPPSCPHGRKIPRGDCCKAFKESVEPIIVALEKVDVGEEVSVVFIHTSRHAYLQRLSAFGLLPGCEVRIRQKNPALIIQLGQTDLALDNRAGEEIFVRRKK